MRFVIAIAAGLALFSAPALACPMSEGTTASKEKAEGVQVAESTEATPVKAEKPAYTPAPAKAEKTDRKDG